jgi:hypothetical protein
MDPHSAAERSAQARRASLIGHARGRTNTGPARAAFFAQFLQKADPGGVLPEAERIKRAKQLRRAYYAELLGKALASRRRKREAKALAQAMLQEGEKDG